MQMISTVLVFFFGLATLVFGVFELGAWAFTDRRTINLFAGLVLLAYSLLPLSLLWGWWLDRDTPDQGDFIVVTAIGALVFSLYIVSFKVMTLATKSQGAREIELALYL